MKDWDAIKNKKKHFMERTHCHCPIRNWDQFSSVSWQELEQGEHHQQNGFTLKFNRTMIQRLHSVLFSILGLPLFGERKNYHQLLPFF